MSHAPAHVSGRPWRVARLLALAGLGLLVAPADAGDILRGGAATGTSTRRNGATPANAGAAAAAQAQGNARDRLARTTQSIDAVKAMQAAARAAAAGRPRLDNPLRPGKSLPRVTNGLSANGLKLAAGVPKDLRKPGTGENPALWTGAELPTERRGQGGKVAVTIVQTEQQALLNWEKFNVGKKTTLTFDQSAGGADRSKWVAFNKINDPTGKPSQILGSIKADGQVYVINQNGIIFGGTSQVNARSLTAAALPINDNLISSGLLNNTSAQFLFSALVTDSFDSTATTALLLSEVADARGKLRLTYTDVPGAEQSFEPGVDYTVAVDEERRSTITFTEVGRAKLATAVKPNSPVVASYLAQNGDITVKAGAQIASPTSAEKVGGRVMLAGANVTNSGSISTPDGQAILAAGLQVGISVHDSDDTSLRGIDIAVGAIADPASKGEPFAGTAINEGLIDAPRANVTIAGKSVQQNGFIDSRTTVSLNGRIDLDANYDAIANPAYDVNGPSDDYKLLFVPRSTGVVTFGGGSVTRILPELSSSEERTGDEVALRSQINARGLAVHFEKDAILLAPNGKVGVRAGGWNFIPSTTAAPPVSEFAYAAGQIYLDAGAMIDVAGTTDVAVPQSDRILTVELRGSELADAPLQRDGALRGVELTIDARETGMFNGREWIGTPLGDARGFVGLLENGVGPLTTKGGSVDLQAGESVVLRRGAMIDVSGGWQLNEGGFVKTTKLRQGNRLVDIADATPDQLYDGIYDPKSTQTHAKWGITKTFRNPFDLNRGVIESSTIQGAAGGSIAITAPSMALDGRLAGATVAGPKQVRQNASTSTLPPASKIALTFRADDPDPEYGEAFSATSPHPPRVVFGDAAQAKLRPFALDALGNPLAFTGDPASSLLKPFKLRVKRRELVVLSPSLVGEGGFGELTVDNGAGDIAVPEGIALEAPAEGAVILNGRNIDVQGRITSPGGTIRLTANNVSPYLVEQIKNRDATLPFTPVFADPTAGRFTLGASGVVSTAGLVIDERNGDPGAPPPLLMIEGGTIDIAAYTARLAAGSLVDVSGGVVVDALSTVRFGDAGTIAIRAGKDPNLAALFPAPRESITLKDRLLGGRLSLRGELRGYSGTKGGSLALQAPFVQVGGARTAETVPGTVILRPEFFDRGGFTNFDLAGIGGARRTLLGASEDLPGLVIAANTELAPRAISLFVDPRMADRGTFTISRILRPVGERTPVSLGFRSLGMSDEAQNVAGNVGILFRGDLEVEDGAVIRTDPRASVSFTGDTVAILGRVSAPAGRISVKGGGDSIKIFKQDPTQAVAMPTVYFGSESRLWAGGTTVLTPDPYGRRVGSVLGGGAVTVAGNIVAAKGSSINVTGASDVLDYSPLVLDAAASRVISVRSGLNQPLQALQTVPVRVDSDGGTITLAGSEMLFTDATLRGRAGGPAGLGGTLDISSGRFSLVGSLPTDANLIVTQGNRAIREIPLPSIFRPGEQTAIGRPVVNPKGEIRAARGYFAVDQFLDGGFDSLALGGVVRFKGPVALEARGSIKVATDGVLFANDEVNLTAPYVALGMPFEAPLLPTDPKSPFTSPTNPYNFSPTHGPGRLTVRADLIDIGNLSLRHIRSARFIAENGDIRGAGTLNIAGRLRFTAGQIYTPTALNFTAVAYDFPARGAEPGTPFTTGAIIIRGVGSRQLPLSAGGTLSFYATNIDHAGVLRAPMGTINLGWDGTGEKPVDLIAGDTRAFPITKRLFLDSQSVTSVSAVDPATGEGMIIPYGISLDGNSWIDPTGIDVTKSGLPGKTINLSASKIVTRSSSEIDLRGGGDLYAYRWIAGNGGTQDLLASETSFAVLPGYQANFAPFAPFNDNETVTAFNRDPLDATTRDAGYVNRTLTTGDRVTLGASDGLPAGTYTLLPARYALLPGAFLVTPKSGSTIGALAMPDGANLVSGYRSNDLGSRRVAPSVLSPFEVASGNVVRRRAEYEDFGANRFLRDAALAENAQPQPLPFDAGHLTFQATEAMTLKGLVRGKGAFGGRGAFIDVSSPADIVIAGPGADLGGKRTENAIVLRARRLTGWGAESLLVGGIRRATEDGTTVTTATGNITVDNAAAPLSAPEILLVANKTLTLAPDAEIVQSGSLVRRAESLLLDGDGALLRVSSDPRASFSRTNVTTSEIPKMTIGAGVILRGTSLALDSTFATDLSPDALLRGRAINLSSGQVSLRLDGPGKLQPTVGLVLAGRALRSVSGADSLSLLSYSSIDIYGTGMVGSRELENLEMHAGEIRGYNVDRATFVARNVLLDNRAAATSPGPNGVSEGTFEIRANTLELGPRQLRIDQFERVNISATGGILLGGKGRLRVDADLNVRTPAFFALGGATETIRATGDVKIRDSRTRPNPDLASGLGASLTIQGAGVTVNSDVLLPSGLLTLRATEGDVNVNGRLDVGGTAQRFNDLVKYTGGGAITLQAEQGDVNFGKRSALDVAAEKSGGDAGGVFVGAAQGIATLAGTLFGEGGAKGRSGTFSLDVSAMSGFSRLAAVLNAAGFDESRNFRVRRGDVQVDGLSTARNFRLATDAGSIVVTGRIDASGATGGAIALQASSRVVLAEGSLLDVSGQNFSAAGKGGSVTLEAGSQVGGVIDPTALLDLRSGSTIDLSVERVRPNSAELGRFTGTLHLRAPQTADGTDVRMAAIAGSIKNASSIVVEGYKLYDLTATNGNLSGSTPASTLQILKDNVLANGNLFVGAAATTTATYTAMHDRLLAGNAALDAVLSIRPGAEIIHRTGNLTFGTSTSTNANDDWNFGAFRFGPKSAPGVLTLRAAGDLLFNNALHDGFAIRTPTAVRPLTTAEVYQAALLDANPLLPMNAQSWSYRITAGADFSASDYRRVRPLASLLAKDPVTKVVTLLGSLKLGRNVPRITSGGTGVRTATLIANRYQVIRTGSGDIDISAGRDVQLLNQFATIYTAGTKIDDPTLGGTFDLPVTYPGDQVAGTNGLLGAVQQNPGYPAQFTLGGGDVRIEAQGDIAHLTRQTTINSPLVADSSRQLPVNWLYRRGFVDPATGRFGTTPTRLLEIGGTGGGDVTSTSWWVDFSNFFEGVGALGGGNVSLLAGNDVSNVDGLVPTNARLPKTATRADQLIEIGGGDLLVRAGGDIDAGVYYAERGIGILSAGKTITTNATRSPSIAGFKTLTAIETPAEQAWLPTTLFLGKGRFDVSARGDVLLGPTANVFLLPEGLNNSIWYKTYFSTYAPTSEVNVSSLGGAVTLRTRAVIPNAGTQPLLQAWLRTQLLLTSTSAAFYQPWLRINEISVDAVPTATSLLPPTLRATAFSGDLNLVGTFNLSPATRGTLEFAAGGAVNGLQPNGSTFVNGAPLVTWGTTRINVSDADPAVIPGVLDPYAYREFVGPVGDSDFVARATLPGYLLFLDRLFAETGTLDSVLQTKQTLHAPGPLHAGDTSPLRLYALAGDISGLTLFSPKASRIVAGQDITDNAFYIQNLAADDISIVAAGRNITAYNASSPLRTLSQAPGNLPPGTVLVPQAPLAGDIQVSGPGTLAVLAGGTLDLGTGTNNPDGTGTGITTVGNARNPNLPFDGANILAAAGIGPAAGLADSNLDVAGFIDEYLAAGKGAKYLAEIDPKLTLAAFALLPEEQRARIAIEAFYLVLRDAGRGELAGAEGYDTGYAAIATLFPDVASESGLPPRGDITTRSREIRTKSGGSISLLIPHGELTLATSTIGNPLVPPGVITETGGDVSIFAHDDVDIGIGRIFTLRGGNIIIWSSTGDIAAGAASKTVKSAPPTRVLIDPQSAAVQTDLAGLSTGGGIGVLATVAGVPPGDVDLIAPVGVVDAGDAGIRVSGNLTIAATAVLNADNIAVAGNTAGVPTAPVVAAPNIAGLTAGNTAAGAASNAANDVANQARQSAPLIETPSDITVEILGYGGGEDQAAL